VSNVKSELRVQGYGVNDAGHIECRREPFSRYSHEHVALIRLNVGDSKAAKDFCGKVIAATDEPGALVGFGRTGAVILFRTNGTQSVEADAMPGRADRTPEHPFIFEGEQAAFIATSDRQTLDVGAFQWRDNRSPLTVPRANLPPLFSDISRRAYDAVGKLLPAHAGRWGKLPTGAEIAAEQAATERLERIGREIAAGMHTPEKIAEREDDALVAEWEGQDIAQSDGHHALQVLQARRRVAYRKRLAAESAVAMTAA
jgi:hypothetical protein